MSGRLILLIIAFVTVVAKAAPVEDNEPESCVARLEENLKHLRAPMKAKKAMAKIRESQKASSGDVTMTKMIDLLDDDFKLVESGILSPIEFQIQFLPACGFYISQFASILGRTCDPVRFKDDQKRFDQYQTAIRKYPDVDEKVSAAKLCVKSFENLVYPDVRNVIKSFITG